MPTLPLLHDRAGRGPLDDLLEVARVLRAEMVEAALRAAGAAQVHHHDGVAARREVAGQAERLALGVLGAGQDPRAVAVGERAVVGAGLEDDREAPGADGPHDLEVQLLTVVGGRRTVSRIVSWAGVERPLIFR